MITSSVAVILLGQQSLTGKPAPEFIGTEWLNSEKPITMASRKGKVTVVHFWTFGCINCKRNLPPVQRLYDKFKARGVEFISIHTPELKEERDVENVKKAVKDNNIKYPVLIDPQYENWKAWKVEYWPTFFIIDQAGNIRGNWAGELNYNGSQGEAKAAAYIEGLLNRG
ncbi:MAG TPA: redoxin domain-containing protein [Fimbriimonas sp.]|nr:redoxin domain-containing protein [Fimbriimonas sp.]